MVARIDLALPPCLGGNGSLVALIVGNQFRMVKKRTAHNGQRGRGHAGGDASPFRTKTVAHGVDSTGQRSFSQDNARPASQTAKRTKSELEDHLSPARVLMDPLPSPTPARQNQVRRTRTFLLCFAGFITL